MMTQRGDYTDEFRATSILREFEDTRPRVYIGPAGVFVRVALAVVFLYLTVVSYLVLGVPGPVFVSILFVMALLAPHFYQVTKNLLERPRVPKDDRVLTPKSPQEG